MTQSDPIYADSLTSGETFDLTAQEDDLSRGGAPSALVGAATPKISVAHSFDLRALLQKRSGAERALHLAVAMVVEPDEAGLARPQLARRRVRGW